MYKINAFDWQSEYKTILLNGGFDIVLGNPPYVQLQTMEANIKNYYSSKYQAKSMVDIYQLFYEKALDLLNPRGIIGFITSNKWMRAGYGEATRKLFTEKANIHGIIDLGGGVFESATVDTNIIFYNKIPIEERILTFPARFPLKIRLQAKAIKPINYRKPIEELKNLVLNDDSVIILDGNAWIIANKSQATILEKMNKVDKPLKDWDITINSGIKTGFNEAFIIDGATKDRLIAEDEKSAEIIKPLLKGRDIKKHYYEFADKWLIVTLPALKLNINNYPAIKKHLKSFGKRLHQTGEKGSRKKTNNKWFETQDSIAYYEDFEKPKIIFNKASQTNSFYLDLNKYYGDVTTYIINTQNNHYIIAILNSRFFEFTYANFFAGGGIEGELTLFTLKEFPISVPSEEQEKKLVKLVDNIIAVKNKMATIENPHEKEIYERQALGIDASIDAIVYGLYNFIRG